MRTCYQCGSEATHYVNVITDQADDYYNFTCEDHIASFINMHVRRTIFRVEIRRIRALVQGSW